MKTSQKNTPDTQPLDPVVDGPFVTDLTEGFTPRTDIVSVRSFLEKTKEALGLNVFAGRNGLDIRIGEKSLNRPALALTGYFKHFANKRLQLFGIGEMAYLHDLPQERQIAVLDKIMEFGIPGILVSSNELNGMPALQRIADRYNVPVLSSKLASKDLFPETTIWLERLFAPRVSLHATLVSVSGTGVLLYGKSGVGKSECALTLIERGHSLVADDTVIVELRGDRSLHGYAKVTGRGAMECRGVGIINVASLFGVRAVLLEKTVDMVIEFRDWEEGIDEDRTGNEQHLASILGKQIPHVTLTVRPGRDMARLVEVASMVHALRQTGYDFSREFNQKLIASMNPVAY
jgi:HPr kinase/phosphorylase